MIFKTEFKIKRKNTKQIVFNKKYNDQYIPIVINHIKIYNWNIKKIKFLTHVY